MTDPSLRSHLRLVRTDLASYIRPFTRDFADLARCIAAGYPVGSGVIIDARQLPRSDDLRRMVRDKQLELILDPLSVELSTEGGLQRSGVADLPWASPQAHTPADISHNSLRNYCEALARAVVDSRATAILAPTHYLESIPSHWIGTDSDLTAGLRDALNRLGRENVNIYYPVVAPLRLVQAGTRRDYLFEHLAKLVEKKAIDALWLRMAGFGVTHSGPVNLRRYFEFARAAHQLSIPVVAERTGTVGLALLAFGAVGGIEQGITLGERYDIGPLMRRSRQHAGYMPPPRVYVPEIGTLLSRASARLLLGHRTARHRFECQRPCCPRGFEDMIANPRRHFLTTRAGEVRELSHVPEGDRPDHFLESWLRPATDRANWAAQIDPSLGAHRDRIAHWRVFLGDQRDQDRVAGPSHSAVPTGLRLRRGA